MTFNYLPVIFLVSYIAFLQVHGQYTPCSPDPVVNITLTLENVLYWEPPDSSCRASYYFIYIEHELGETQHTYMAVEPQFYIHFLQICESYYFNIIAMSAMGGRGPNNYIFDRMPFPPDANLTVGMFSVSPRGSDINLEWQVQEEWRKCADRFRISVYDTESDNPLDLYVSTSNATITNLVPCTTYIFGVRAIYNLGTEGPLTSTRYTTPAAKLSAPALQGVTPGRTTIDLTWQLDSYSINRCAVSSLTIDAAPFFRITYPISDQSTRPPVSVRLTGLDPDTLYTLNVTVTNTAGVSPPTLLEVQTLE